MSEEALDTYNPDKQKSSDHTIIDGSVALSDEQTKYLAYSLAGTADSGWLDDYFEHPDFEGLNAYDLHQETLRALDAQVQRCQQCDWWFEVSELQEDGDGCPICDDCVGIG